VARHQDWPTVSRNWILTPDMSQYFAEREVALTGGSDNVVLAASSSLNCTTNAINILRGVSSSQNYTAVLITSPWILGMISLSFFTSTVATTRTQAGHVISFYGVLTVVYNTGGYRVFGFCPTSAIPKGTKNIGSGTETEG
jgi:hypothetical protein